jgi:hypothetical protein
MSQSYVPRLCSCAGPRRISRDSRGSLRCGLCGLLVRKASVSRAHGAAGQPGGGTPTPAPGAARPAADWSPFDAVMYYRIERTAGGVFAWAHHASGKRVAIPHIVKHSPTGMEFGYGGSGPCDLALSIVAYELRREDIHPRIYQSFKWTFIASANGDEFTIDRADVVRWFLHLDDKVAR